MSDDAGQDELEVKRALEPLGGEPAAVDDEFLRRLRVQTAAAFMEADGSSSPTVQIAPRPGRRRIWPVWAAAACAAGLAAWLLGPLSPARGEATFGDVLRRTAAAGSLQLELRRGGERTEVWVRPPDLVRFDDSPQKYRIARGSQLWQIDECENRAARGKASWAAEGKPLDLVALLAADSAVELNAAFDDESMPVGERQYLGRRCLVFQKAVERQGEPLVLEAFADAQTLELKSLVLRQDGVKGQPASPPLAELRLLAVNPPVDESKFVVAKSLTEDGRIGKVVDLQGLVSLQPALASRWTPVCGPLVLKPGDWIRTETRGANAVRIRLSSEVELTLGPGGLVELVGPHHALLHSGELQIASDKANEHKFLLEGPSRSKHQIASGAVGLFRTRQDAPLATLEHKPKWLEGFEGAATGESLGSLIATVDGRSVPLSVGYHKVRVDVRDQIARTTIEESFVNHTDGRLEGVFYFPLPADASISGFGMWIGDELVEADVVEKQRAREIYETILRERRDPGLLEWTSGNVFKARVFPIEPNSEKRIKLVYAQVLPLRNNRYRYSYGLRSELLRTRPLRELSIDVQVSSELPLRGVECPTHMARTEQTEHAAHVQFAAEEYVPTRDFEVVCAIDGRQSDVVVIPHQRGDDGYFLMQLTPPAPDGNWRRETLRDGEPVDVLLLCDTSLSMDRESRRQQREFTAAVLGSLAVKDRFNLAVCDVECSWVFEEASPATGENVARALAALDKRRSLGWTDLERSFESALGRCGPRTQVVYIGDGIPSAGDADPQATAGRLGRLYQRRSKGTCHAVSVGNAQEAAVLKAIAAMGGGSLRHIGGEQSPAATALELLREITEPGLRDLTVEFQGLSVAAVYPERLPNLASGAQQILVGRYLPEASQQTGELVATGRRGEETVRYATRVTFPSQRERADGNSFIPRLWARAHLDHLLQQGSSQAIRDEIISMSEEFHIITPYTSLLVLETDEDRERFGVKRRFQIRDGEQFFAKGRDDARYELVQQQMRRAHQWRAGLRQQVLQSLSSLGRDYEALEQAAQELNAEEMQIGLQGIYASRGPAGFGGGFGGGGSFGGAGFGGGMGGGAGTDDRIYLGVQLNRPLAVSQSQTVDFDSLAWHDEILVDSWDENQFAGAQINELYNEFAGKELHEHEYAAEGKMLATRFSPVGDLVLGDERNFFGQEEFAPSLSTTITPSYAGARIQFMDEPTWDMAGRGESVIGRYVLAGSGAGSRGYSSPPQDEGSQWLAATIPALPAPPSRRQEDDRAPHADWPADAVAISKDLLRMEKLRQIDGGLEIRRTDEELDPRWNRTVAQHDQLELYAPKAWLTRPTGQGVHTVVHWCDAGERGVLSRAFRLGRVRRSTSAELDNPPLELEDDSITALHEQYRQWKARVERGDDGQIQLILSPPETVNYETRLTIDPQRNVLLKRENWSDGSIESTTEFEDFVEAGGCWWARRITVHNAAGKPTRRITQSVTPLTSHEYAQRLKQELRAIDVAYLIKSPLADLQTARNQAVDGSAGADDRLVLLLDYCSRQQWEQAFEQLEAMERLTGDEGAKDRAAPLRWIRLSLDQAARRNEGVLRSLHREARRLAAEDVDDRFYVAEYLLIIAQSIAEYHEQLSLLDELKSVFAGQPDHVGGMTFWQARRVDLLRSLEQTEELVALHRELAESMPWDDRRQIAYADDLVAAGRDAEAYAWLERAMDQPQRDDWESKSELARAYADLLHSEAQFADEAKYWLQVTSDDPDDQHPYDRLLSAWVFSEALDRTESQVESWLTEGRTAESLEGAALARFQAAVDYVRGEREELDVEYTEDKWLPLLGEIALEFVGHRRHAEVARRILNDGRFSETDEGDRVRRKLFERLQRKAGELWPNELNLLVDVLVHHGSLQDEQAWEQIARAVRTRWDAATDERTKMQLDEALVQIYSSRLADSQYVPFLRARLAAADKSMRTEYARQLLAVLVSRPWTHEIESEAFSLLPKLSESNDEAHRLAVQLPELYRLVDQMIEARVTRDRSELDAAGHPEKLTRTELAAKYAEFRKAALRGVADRLAAVADGAEEPLARWLEMERTTLDVWLERRLDDALASVWKILGDAPPALPAGEIDSDPNRFKHYFDLLHRERAFAIAMQLAARRDARPEAAERLIRYIDAGIDRGGQQADPWRAAKFRLLISLDRADDLERQLRRWIAEGGPASPWRSPLAHLLAERGRLDEAIPILESVKAIGALSASDEIVLAGWYMAVDRRADHEQARVNAYLAVDEDELEEFLEARLDPWQQDGKPLPTQLDEGVLYAFQALFQKSAWPDSYLPTLGQFYRASRDFRLLAMVPDGVLGRTRQEIYPFLESLEEHVLKEIRDEAVADKILERIVQLQTGDRSDLDRRALSLLEALVERRAAEAPNQSAPHIEAATAALDRVFRLEWAEGERLQMARLLSKLGRITASTLAEKQLQQLGELHAQTPAGTLERLEIAASLAYLRSWSYDRQDNAITELEAAIHEFEQPREGVWPPDALKPLETYLDLLGRRGRFAEVETAVQRLAQKPATPDMANWFEDRLNQTYLAALEADAETSLGAGESLYRSLVDRLTAAAERGDQYRRYPLVQRLIELFRKTDAKATLRAVDVKRDLREFAFNTFPNFLKQQKHYYEMLVENVADALHDLAGPRAALEFLILQMQTYPARFEMGRDRAWSEFGWRLADWRSAVGKELGDLEQPLFELAERELRRSLTRGESSGAYLLSKSSGYFWKEKEDEFTAIAEQILNERRRSARAVLPIAHYFWRGLERRDRAIEILKTAHRDGLLDDAAQYELVAYLHEAKRHAESIPFLEGLVERRPDDLTYRTALMAAFFHADQSEKSSALLKKTDSRFRRSPRWNEQNMATLAEACRDAKLFRQAVAYYDEAIATRQRQYPGRGVGDGTLARYFQGLAESHAGLGDTPKAVDAAASAVVSWGSGQEEQTEALATLRSVLEKARNLDAFVESLDQQAKETGEDSPLIRRTLGDVLRSNEKLTEAEAQYRLAAQLEPIDLEILRDLVECLDEQAFSASDTDAAAKKSAEAIDVRLQMIDVDRHDLELFEDLAGRLSKDANEAERAATSIVEASPQEAENHAALAELRERRNRWEDALVHWRHVARLRALEPTGLLRLAKAQVQLKQWDEAEATVQQLEKTPWPARFNDVQENIRDLERQIAAGRQ